VEKFNSISEGLQIYQAKNKKPPGSTELIPEAITTPPVIFTQFVKLITHNS